MDPHRLFFTYIKILIFIYIVNFSLYFTLNWILISWLWKFLSYNNLRGASNIQIYYVIINSNVYIRTLIPKMKMNYALYSLTIL